MRLDGAEVGAELHLRDLHVALGVEDDGGLGVDVQVVDLEPDVPVPVQGEQAHDQTGQVVPGVTLHSTNQSNMEAIFVLTMLKRTNTQRRSSPAYPSSWYVQPF